jgi:hypothetical protein
VFDTMKDVIEQFATWALNQADVWAAIIVWSQALADKMSDLDLAIVVTDPSIESTSRFAMELGYHMTVH